MPRTIPIEIARFKRMPYTRVMPSGKHFYLYTTNDIPDESGSTILYKKNKALGKFILKDGEVSIEYNDYYLRKDRITKLNYGGFKLIENVCSSILDDLRFFFSEKTAQRLYVLAVLTCLYPRYLRIERVKYLYLRNYICIQYPNICLSENTLSDFLEDVGRYSEQRQRYLESRIKAGSGEYFTDGTLVPNSSKTILSSWVKRGQITKPSPMINIIYIYDAKNKIPVYYKTFRGNIKDSTAISKIIKEAGIQQCLLIADKGFNNTLLIEEYDNLGIDFLVPLNINSKQIDQKIDLNYQGGFLGLHHNPIYYTKRLSFDNKHWIYTFLDKKIALSREVTYFNKTDFDNSLTLQQDLKQMGVIHLITSLDQQPKDIYYKYLSRWNIEAMNDYFKNTFIEHGLYSHTECGLEGLLFVKSIALEMFYRIANYSYNQPKPISPEILLNDLNEISVEYSYNKWEIITLTKKEQKLLENYGITIALTPSETKLSQQQKTKLKPIKRTRGRPPGSTNTLKKINQLTN